MITQPKKKFVKFTFECFGVHWALPDEHLKYTIVHVNGNWVRIESTESMEHPNEQLRGQKIAVLKNMADFGLTVEEGIKTFKELCIPASSPSGQ